MHGGFGTVSHGMMDAGENPEVGLEITLILICRGQHVT